MNASTTTVQIVLPLPLEDTFFYAWPDALGEKPCIGHRVLAPFGKRRLAGYVVEIHPDGMVPDNIASKDISIRDVLELLDEQPLFGRRELEFYRWVAQYYLSSLGETLRTALPVSMHLRSARAVHILPQGLHALQIGAFLTGQELGVLRLLEKGGKRGWKSLREEVGSPLDRIIPDLEAKGFVESCLVYKGSRAPSRGEALPLHPPPFEDDSPLLVLSSPHTLTRQQEDVVREILPSVNEGRYRPFLLHGVTGSGKTEVYLHVIQHALQLGRQALVLVPEIALTPQTLRLFTARFGPNVALVHSNLADGERLERWWRIRKGLVRIAIGTRSAVFSPFQNLGIIVVDEEHDPSYKQQDRLRYNARDLALVRGQREGATVLLGSATPSLESYYNAHAGKNTLLELTERVEGLPLPPVDCIDLRDRASVRDRRDSISIPLEKSLRENLQQGKKSLLFLNRRGYASTLVCQDCGHLFRCPHCSVTLTLHRAGKRICCHYCEHHEPQPKTCPACRGHSILATGRGTERIEEEVRAVVPGVRTGRMDRDTTRGRGSHEKLLQAFRGDELDILIGTQMIAKGHDIPEITVVGVVLADGPLDLPDFRASERTFQLLLQVAGRAGRGRWPGRVLVQTRHPDHFCIRAMALHDYKSFYEQEIAFRKELEYPPFSRMINMRVSGRDEDKTVRAAARIGDLAREGLRSPPFSGSDLEVLGPSQAPLAKLMGRFRFHCFLKGNPPRLVQALARQVSDRVRPMLKRDGVRLELDVDPIQVL